LISDSRAGVRPCKSDNSIGHRYGGLGGGQRSKRHLGKQVLVGTCRGTTTGARYAYLLSWTSQTPVVRMCVCVCSYATSARSEQLCATPIDAVDITYVGWLRRSTYHSQSFHGGGCLHHASMRRIRASGLARGRSSASMQLALLTCRPPSRLRSSLCMCCEPVSDCLCAVCGCGC
jgi:hypothetical protein